MSISIYIYFAPGIQLLGRCCARQAHGVQMLRLHGELRAVVCAKWRRRTSPRPLAASPATRLMHLPDTESTLDANVGTTDHTHMHAYVTIMACGTSFRTYIVTFSI